MSQAQHIEAILALLPPDQALSGKVLCIEFDDGCAHDSFGGSGLVVTNSGRKLAVEMVQHGWRSRKSNRVQYRAFGQQTETLDIEGRNGGCCATVEVNFHIPVVKVL